MTNSALRMQFKIEVDNSFTPWGEPEIIGEMLPKIANGEWTAYSVTATVVGVPAATSSLYGCVVATTVTGTYDTTEDIPDEYLREVAEENAEEARELYPTARLARIAEIRKELAQTSAEADRLRAELVQLNA